MSTDREILRKLVHVAFGFCALLLRWLAPWQAALFALAAWGHNRFILPRTIGRHISRHERGTDRGILIYPLAVLALILAFWRDPGIAAAVWGILAFGDGLATVAGRLAGGPRLPWNREKTVIGSLVFALAGGTAALLLGSFVQPGPGWLLPWSALALVTAIACAAGESLAIHVDDNVVVPLVGALVMGPLSRIRELPPFDAPASLWIWLAANALLAGAGWLARSVTVSGAVGGFLLGAALILFAGWELYVVLLAFFVIGTAATKLGYRRKAAEGLAQEEGGRRGFSHAWSNVGVAAVLALYIALGAGEPSLLWLAAIASLATAGADTTASEIGQLYGRRTFHPLTFRPLARGTEGAVSVEGTLAGALVALGIGALGVWLVRGRLDLATPAAVAAVTAAAVAGSWLESLAGIWNRRQARPVPNGALNFFNTLTGALLAVLLATMLKA